VSEPKTKHKLKPKPPSDIGASVRAYFDQFDGLEHLRVRERADLLVLESGPIDDPIPHARLRRLGREMWRLEMATHTGRWQVTPDHGPLRLLLQRLTQTYGWILAPRE
jgi:hypothetical protein